MSKQENLLKVHVGCGKNLLDGWVNADRRGEVDVVWDLYDAPPFENLTVDYVFTEHVLEHFTLVEGRKLLTTFRKILKHKGRIRVSVPDLVSCIESYQDGYGVQFRNEKQPQLSKMKSNAQYLNNCFREFGHKFIYDEEALTLSLEEVGFVDIKRYDPGESDDPVLQNIERRIKGLNSSQHSLCLEATKP